MKILERFLDWLIAWIYKRRAVNPNARCPACSAKQGSIRYDPETQKVLHSCAVCSAVWPENPRIPPHAWDLAGKFMKQRADSVDNIKKLFDGGKVKANATS